MVSRTGQEPALVVETGLERLTIRLLGGFEVTIGERPVGDAAWSPRKAGSLVKLLSLAPSHRLHREQAMDALWPDLGPRAASGNLRKALHFARHALAPTARAAAHPYLQTRGEFLLLSSPGQLWVDVGAFQEASDKARRSADTAIYRQAI